MSTERPLHLCRRTRSRTTTESKRTASMEDNEVDDDIGMTTMDNDPERHKRHSKRIRRGADSSSRNMNKKFITFSLLLGLLATAASAVQIRELKVPSTYILDINDPDPPPIYMDCMYDVQPDESGFVLKWMLDGITIYQWIPPKRPQAIAFFKTRADTTYEIEGDTLGRFRSLKIIRPEFNMTGEFTCSVQTFKSSDKRSAKLQIIVPDRDFQLTYKCCDHGHVIIKCTTTGVFPKPKLTIMIDNGVPLNEETEGSGQSNDGLYEAIVRVKIPKINLKSPTAINCVLTIPGTNYTKKQETIYYDTMFTTMSPDEDRSSSISHLAVYGKNGASATVTTGFASASLFLSRWLWPQHLLPHSLCTLIGILLLIYV